MKKTYFALAAIVASMGLFASCSSDEAESMTSAPKGNTISLTSSFQGTRAISELQSTQLSTSISVGVFGIAGNATLANGNNQQYSVAVNGDLNTTDNMVWPSIGEVSIYAYAPYQEAWSYNADNAFAVSVDQSTDTGYLQSDLVYGTPADNPVAQTEDPIALAFVHKLAKLNITVQKASGATIDLTDASVTVMNTKIATTLNPSTGAVGEAIGDATDILTVSTLGDATTACAIIVPQQLTADTRLVKIEADGKILYAKLGAATTFVGGKSYNFTVKVGSTEEPVTEVTLALGSTSVVNWDSEDLGQSEADGKLYATFGTPGGNASYDAETFTYAWTGSTNNLMNCFTFENGELANYTTLNFTFSELSEGASVRINVLFSDNTNKTKSYYNAGTKATAISDFLSEGKTAADIVAVRFGGNSGSGSTIIKASEMYFE